MSALPWHIEDSSFVINADGHPILYVDDGDMRRFIVRAVNSYAAREELLAALKAMVDRWEPDACGLDYVLWGNAKAAIQKAEAHE
jgi:hypothetical protein